ncbi:MAG: c-type cytochrome domain-containing protein [bacterium]
MKRVVRSERRFGFGDMQEEVPSMEYPAKIRSGESKPGATSIARGGKVNKGGRDRRFLPTPNLPMSYDPESEAPKSYTLAWIASLLLLVGFIIGLLIYPPLYEAPKAEAGQMTLFIGRFHPILLHLPIGSLSFLMLLELLCMSRSGESKHGSTALLALWVGAAGSVLAVLAGIMLSREGGYTGGNFSLHQTMAIIGTAGVLLALVIRLVAMGQSNFELLHAYRALFFLSFGIMGLGAHFGGNMSHGSKFLTEFAPEPIKGQMVSMEKWMLSFVEKPKPEKVEEPAPEAPKATEAPKVVETPPTTPTPTPAPTMPPAAPAAGDKYVFANLIQPIFAAKCNKCHGEEKQKGDLRLDTYEATMAGGSESAEKKNNIVPGKPADSLTYQLVISAEDEDMHMPPEGKDQLTKEEVAILKWWIEQGASNTQKLDIAAIPADLQAAASAIAK